MLHDLEHSRRNETCNEHFDHAFVKVFLRGEDSTWRDFDTRIGDTATIVVYHTILDVAVITALVDSSNHTNIARIRKRNYDKRSRRPLVFI